MSDTMWGPDDNQRTDTNSGDCDTKLPPLKRYDTPQIQQSAAPQLVLNANDKIFLAVSQKTSPNMLYMVYSLVARRQGQSNTYSAFAETDVAIFEDKKSAFIYAETAREIADYQKKTMPQVIAALRAANSDMIKNFYENTR